MEQIEKQHAKIEKLKIEMTKQNKKYNYEAFQLQINLAKFEEKLGQKNQEREAC